MSEKNNYLSIARMRLRLANWKFKVGNLVYRKCVSLLIIVFM